MCPMGRRARSLFLLAISPRPRTVSGTELALSRYFALKIIEDSKKLLLVFDMLEITREKR